MAILGKLGNYRSTALLIMRVGLGLMMIVAHGYSKLIGGPEMWTKIGSSMSFFGIHSGYMIWGLLSALTESVGGLLIVLGLFFRPICLFMMINLFVAATHHFVAGQGLAGAAHAIEVGFAFIGLFILGPGRYSVDKT